jgi:predicted amidophosphoribosyltransferase
MASLSWFTAPVLWYEIGMKQARDVFRICPQCGAAFDRFRAQEQRGKWCSPACMEAARQARRSRVMAQDDAARGREIAGTDPPSQLWPDR